MKLKFQLNSPPLDPSLLTMKSEIFFPLNEDNLNSSGNASAKDVSPIQQSSKNRIFPLLPTLKQTSLEQSPYSDEIAPWASQSCPLCYIRVPSIRIETKLSFYHLIPQSICLVGKPPQPLHKQCLIPNLYIPNN